MLFSSYLIAQNRKEVQLKEYFNEHDAFSFNIEYAIGNFIRGYDGVEIQNSSGFLFGGIEFEKHLIRDYSLFLETSLILNFPIPVPASITCDPFCENLHSALFSTGIKKTFRINDKHAISIGSGISLAKYDYSFPQVPADSISEPVDRKFDLWGFGLNGDLTYLYKVYRKNRYRVYGIGVNYSPTFIHPEANEIKYLYTLNIKLIYRISIWRSRVWKLLD